MIMFQYSLPGPQRLSPSLSLPCSRCALTNISHSPLPLNALSRPSIPRYSFLSSVRYLLDRPQCSSFPFGVLHHAFTISTRPIFPLLFFVILFPRPFLRPSLLRRQLLFGNFRTT